MSAEGGGRFAAASTGWDGDKMKKKFGKPFNLFLPKVAAARNAMNGAGFPAIPMANDPIAMGVTDALGRPVDPEGAYPLRLFTYKEAFGGHSRTISNYWSNVGLQPENKVLMARRDAEAMGIASGDEVRVTSPSLPSGEFSTGDGRTKAMVGKAKVVEGLRPGTVAISWHYGHWAYGSNDVIVDGHTIVGDHRRAAGMCPNPLMLIDPVLGDVCLTDPIGASASFFDSTVAVTKV